MTRGWLALVALAACDLGIGSDPNGGPRSACAPGHARIGPTSGCFTAVAAIAIDGQTDDWSDVPEIAIAPACAAPPCDGLVPVALWIAAGSGSAGAADLLVRASFGGPPPNGAADLRVALTIAASPARPATAGSDRLVEGASDQHYEKNGYVIAPAAPPYQWAWTADGFEARIDGTWSTYQGAARVAVTVERAQGSDWIAVAPTSPADACWDWRSGSDALGSDACEVAPR